MDQLRLISIKRNCQHKYTNWDFEFAKDATIEYLKFLRLKISEMDFDAEKLQPSNIIEKVWQIHILDSKDYFTACGGNYIHHVHEDQNDVFESAKKYNQTFTLLQLEPSDIWPKPAKYIKFIGQDKHYIVPWTNTKAVQANLVRKFQLENLIVTYIGKFEEFGQVRWKASRDPTKQIKKRTRSETVLKELRVYFDGKVTPISVSKKKAYVYDIITIMHSKLGLPLDLIDIKYDWKLLDHDESIDFILPNKTVELVLKRKSLNLI